MKLILLMVNITIFILVIGIIPIVGKSNLVHNAKRKIFFTTLIILKIYALFLLLYVFYYIFPASLSVYALKEFVHNTITIQALFKLCMCL